MLERSAAPWSRRLELLRERRERGEVRLNLGRGRPHKALIDATNAADKERLMAIVRIAMGGTDEFNACIRGLLADS